MTNMHSLIKKVSIRKSRDCFYQGGIFMFFI